MKSGICCLHTKISETCLISPCTVLVNAEMSQLPSHTIASEGGGRDVVFMKENSSCLLRSQDGVRRLVRQHKMYNEYRTVSKGTGDGEVRSIPWPESSKSVCWYCRRYFGTVPVKIPRCRNVDGSWTVYGNFCCFACMVAYMWRARTLTTPEQIALSIQLARECGIEHERLPMAPPLEDLQESGGDLTWDEFDRLCETTAVRLTLRLPPMVETMIGVEETFEAISSGAPGMERVLEDVFGVTPAAVQKARTLAEVYEHRVADKTELMGIDVHDRGGSRSGRAAHARPTKHKQNSGGATNKASATGAVRAEVSSDEGVLRRRLMALINEPATVALDRLRPPTTEEIERRLTSQPTTHHGSQVSLFEQYVEKRKSKELQQSRPAVQDAVRVTVDDETADANGAKDGSAASIVAPSPEGGVSKSQATGEDEGEGMRVQAKEAGSDSLKQGQSESSKRRGSSSRHNKRQRVRAKSTASDDVSDSEETSSPRRSSARSRRR